MALPGVTIGAMEQDEDRLDACCNACGSSAHPTQDHPVDAPSAGDGERRGPLG